MQKFLKTRETLVFCLVLGDLPEPESFQKKHREKCKMPLYTERSADVWQRARYVRQEDKFPLVGIDLTRMKRSTEAVGKTRISRLPDGTKHGPFHSVSEKESVANIYTGNYRMGKKHGNFRILFRILARKKIIQQIWEDGQLKYEKRKFGGATTSIIRFTDENSGIFCIFHSGKLYKKHSFKNRLLHGEQHRYWYGNGTGFTLRTRALYEYGLLRKRTRYHICSGTKQITHYGENGCELHGLRETFDHDGETTRRELFENDELVKEWFC